MKHIERLLLHTRRDGLGRSQSLALAGAMCSVNISTQIRNQPAKNGFSAGMDRERREITGQK
jgi:hypothetical protein